MEPLILVVRGLIMIDVVIGSATETRGSMCGIGNLRGSSSEMLQGEDEVAC
jgi:hypothetical protein